MSECILEWRIAPSYFPVTVTLNSDLVSRIDITSLFFEVGIQIWCVDASWDGQVLYTLFGSL